jgi:hypothetical protein
MRRAVTIERAAPASAEQRPGTTVHIVIPLAQRGGRYLWQVAILAAQQASGLRGERQRVTSPPQQLGITRRVLGRSWARSGQSCPPVTGERLHALRYPRALTSRPLSHRSAVVPSDRKCRPCFRCARLYPEPQPRITSLLRRPEGKLLHLYDSNLTKRHAASTMWVGEVEFEAGPVD